MNVKATDVIGELVAQNYKAAKVFKKHKIDFCCQGGRTITDACAKLNLDVIHVLKELELIDQANQEIDFKKLEADELVSHILENHHSYVSESIPIIQQYLDKICKVHGAYHPELIEVKQLFDQGAVDLSNHMLKEELVLFPRIKSLVAVKKEQNKEVLFECGDVTNPIEVMQEEHHHEGERFRKIAVLTNDYTPPEEACNTYRVVFALLKEFEEDLHKHIHLENNILFPKTIILEAGLN